MGEEGKLTVEKPDRCHPRMSPRSVPALTEGTRVLHPAHNYGGLERNSRQPPTPPEDIPPGTDQSSLKWPRRVMSVSCGILGGVLGQEEDTS